MLWWLTREGGNGGRGNERWKGGVVQMVMCCKIISFVRCSLNLQYPRIEALDTLQLTFSIIRIISPVRKFLIACRELVGLRVFRLVYYFAEVSQNKHSKMQSTGAAESTCGRAAFSPPRLHELPSYRVSSRYHNL